MRHATIAAIILTALASFARAEDFRGTTYVRLQWTHEKTNGFATVAESFSDLFNWTHTSGTNANQMNAVFVSRRTLAGSTNETLNIAGAVTNSFGTTLDLDRVRFIAVKPSSSNVGSLSLGGAASNAFATWLGDSSDKVVVRPGGLFLMVAPDATGFAVSTNGNLKVSNDTTNSVLYDIYIGGGE